MTIDPEKLARLIEAATDEDLSDDGRYFADTFQDLTRCRHEEIGEYQNRGDGPLIEYLWNHRRELLDLARAAAIPKEIGLPVALPLDSGPLRERAAKVSE